MEADSDASLLMRWNKSVSPSQSLALRLPPLRTSSCTTLTIPERAAMCSGLGEMIRSMHLRLATFEDLGAMDSNIKYDECEVVGVWSFSLTKTAVLVRRFVYLTSKGTQILQTTDETWCQPKPSSYTASDSK